MTEANDFIGAGEVAAMANKSENTVRYWVQVGYGPESAKIGRHRVWRRADVQRWLDAQFAGASGTPAA